jgi:hypothetical protein
MVNQIKFFIVLPYFNIEKPVLYSILHRYKLFLSIRGSTTRIPMQLSITSIHLQECFKFVGARIKYTRAFRKVRGFALLLRVGTLGRCGDGLFFEVPPLASDALFTTLHPLLENVLQTVDHFEISCLGAPFSWLEKPRNRMGRDLDCMADVLMGFQLSTISKPNTEFNSDLAPCDFWAFPTMNRELRGKTFRSYQRSAARFREVGGAL